MVTIFDRGAQNGGPRRPADPPGALLFFVIPGLGVSRGHLGEALGPAGALLFFMIPGLRSSRKHLAWVRVHHRCS